ncbi:MAG TPA: NAD(P)-binding domain-containing protein [Actinomycetota bacterium]
MKVTIVGAGNMGRGIGTRAVAGGHQVEILAQDPGHARKLAEELGGSATAIEAGAPFGGEVIVFAVYYPGIKEAVRQYADQLAGKVVVDITNPVDTQTWDRLATPPRHLLGQGGRPARPRRHPGGQGVQHHLRPHPGRR